MVHTFCTFYQYLSHRFPQALILTIFDDFDNFQQFCEILDLGMDGPTKTDEFLEKFQTAFDPPPHFRKIMLRFFSGIHDRRSVYNGKNLQHKFLDWK